MMGNKVKRTPPSRQGKKQVIAFLWPNQIQAVRDKAAKEHKTNQEIIGEALNAVFEKHGMPPLIKPGHHRIVRRTNAVAAVRQEGVDPTSRAGRQALGGWFDKDIVQKLTEFSAEINLSVQGIVELGVTLVTGVAPQEGSLPPQESEARTQKAA